MQLSRSPGGTSLWLPGVTVVLRFTSRLDRSSRRWLRSPAPRSGLEFSKVFCAVDCGLAVNPNLVAAQLESGIGFGLSAALSGAITYKDGRVEQSNFHDYPVVRIHQMPRVDVVIVKTDARMPQWNWGTGDAGYWAGFV